MLWLGVSLPMFTIWFWYGTSSSNLQPEAIINLQKRKITKGMASQHLAGVTQWSKTHPKRN
jgi:hypothetical protein